MLKSSQRIMPLRRYSRGYTGQTSRTLRYKFPPLKEIQDANSIMVELIKSDLTSLNVKDYNQFVRATFFLLVDSVMTLPSSGKEFYKGEFEATIELCNSVIALICKWIKLFPDYYQYYIEATQCLNLSLVSLKHAVAVSFPELSEMLKLVFGLVFRCKDKFNLLNRELNERQSNSKRPLLIDSFRQQNIATFYEAKGFDLVLDIISNTEKQCPILVMTDFLRPLVEALKDSLYESSKSSLERVLKEIATRFSCLSERDIKDLSKAAITELLEIINVTSERSASKELLLKTFFSVAVQLIKTEYIQKKLLGVFLIKSMLPKRCQYGIYEGGKLKWDDLSLLIKTMEEHKLLEIVLGENAHAEILGKIEDVFLFYLQQKKLEKRHIEMLWKCSNEKHEDVMRVCLNLLANLVPEMTFPLIQELFKYIKTVKFRNEIHIKFLEIYTVNVLKFINKFNKKKILEKNVQEISEIIDFDLFWELILNSSTEGKLKDQAMKALIGIINNIPRIKVDYVVKAAELINNEKFAIRGIQFLYDIAHADPLEWRQSLYSIEDLNKSFSIIEFAIKDCEAYHSEVKGKVTPGQTNVIETDFGSGFTFSNQAKLYIEFLLYLCSKSILKLSKDEFLRLWKCYVEEPLGEVHADILFTAMSMETMNATRKFILFSDDTARSVFEQCLCGPETKISHLTLRGFACFSKFMCWINQRELRGAKNSGLEKLQGILVLWKIVFQTNIEVIKEQAEKLLVGFIANIASVNQMQRKQVIEKAFEIALENVKEVSNVSQIKVTLEIIDGIIEAIEKLRYEEIGPEYDCPPFIIFRIYQLGKKKPLLVQINESMRLSNLKCWLSNHLKVHQSRIILKDIETQKEYRSDYNYYLSQFHKQNDNKFLMEIETFNIPFKETPRFILANTAIFNRLEDLLKSPKQEIVNEVWNLITSLPVNQDSEKRLTLLDFQEVPKEPSKNVQLWEKHLEISQNYDSVRLVYYLHILNGRISGKTTDYVDYFLKKRGTDFILEVFSKKISKPVSMLNLKCMEFCIQIVWPYIIKNYDEVFTANCDVQFWNGIVKLIKLANGKHDSSIVDLFGACCEAHYSMLTKNTAFVKNATEKEYIDMLKDCLLQSENKLIQENTNKLLERLVLRILKHEKQKELIKVLMTDFLNTALAECTNPKSYFNLINTLIERTEELDCEALIKEGHVQLLVKNILNKPVNESTSKAIDYSVNGLMDMLRLEFTKYPVLKNQLTSIPTLAQGLLESLFNINKTNARFKSEVTREKALKLLGVLTEASVETRVATLKYFYSLCKNEIASNKLSWSISPRLESRTGSYAGLKNLGATCYMNSSLQQFFMIPQFRKRILEVNHEKKGKQDSVLFQLQQLFALLMKSEKTTYNPKAFTKTIKIDGQVLNPLEQRDVDEFIMHFLDQLEQELKGTNQEKLVKDMFKLTLANEIICKDCPHRSETYEDAITIILSVKNKKTIYEGLKAYIASDTLEGDNAYLCERCNKKVAALKRQSIKTLHNMVVIVLKRFEFDVETLARIKVNDYCEFPTELDFEEFTQESQTCRELKEALECGTITQEDLTEEQRKMLRRKTPKYYYQYKLTGIIIHSGYSDAGHYYSYILPRDNTKDKQWLEFNDATVRDFDSKNIPDDAFGGEEEIYSGYTKKELAREKINNAYVLIYERVVHLNPEALDQYKKEEMEIDPATVERRFEEMKMKEETNDVTIPDFLLEIIHQENKKFWMSQYFYHENYLSFVTNLMYQYKVEEIKTKSEFDVQIFAVIFLLIIALRAENKDNVPRILEFIKSNTNPHICNWICKLFSNSDYIKEYLVNCPDGCVRRWISGLIKFAAADVYLREKPVLLSIAAKPDTFTSPKELHKLFNLPDSPSSQIFFDEAKTPYLWCLVDALLQQTLHCSSQSSDQLFQVFSHIARLGPEACYYLNRCQLIGIVLEHLFKLKRMCSTIVSQKFVHPTFQGVPEIALTTKIYGYGRRENNEYTFAFELLYLLVKTIKLQGANELKDDKYKVKLTEREYSYLDKLKHMSDMESLLSMAKNTKAGLNFYCETLAYLAFDSKEYISLIFNHTSKRFNNLVPMYYKVFFRLLHFLLKHNNDTFDVFLQLFNKHFCNDASNTLLIEALIDFLIKICRNNANYLEQLKQQRTNLYIERASAWLDKYGHSLYTSPVQFS